MMRERDENPNLVPFLRRTLKLLEKIRPEREEGDILWRGPHFTPRRGDWWPTWFLLYRDELYATVALGWLEVTLVWKSRSGEITYQGDMPWDSRFTNGPELWRRVLDQVETRLRSAIANPDAYNRRVERCLPAKCRIGRIKRIFTWPEGAKLPLSNAGLKRLAKALERGRSARPWPSLSLAKYLETAAIAYDAVFSDTEALSPRRKYKRRADTRHGGMLDLKSRDASAFDRWFRSKQWQGCHPWEIVFAHPHGILLAPAREPGGWRFHLGVDTVGLYGEAARMARVLGERGVPFEFPCAQEVIDALRGADRIEVGPFHRQLLLEELQKIRPTAPDHIEWAPFPRLCLGTRKSSRTGTGSPAS